MVKVIYALLLKIWFNGRIPESISSLGQSRTESATLQQACTTRKRVVGKRIVDIEIKIDKKNRKIDRHL